MIRITCRYKILRTGSCAEDDEHVIRIEDGNSAACADRPDDCWAGPETGEMTNLFDTLQRLITSFVASDIMIPKDQILSAENEDIARELLRQNAQYDVIPLHSKGHMVAFLERGNSKSKRIQIEHAVSAGTPILDIVDSFCDRQHLFVLGKCEIIGLIHFSDLNDPVVKLPFFLLLEGLERKITDSIRKSVDEDALPRIITDPKRLNDIRVKMSELQNKKAERDLVSLLYFREILESARYFDKLQLETSQIEDLSCIRNRVAHAAAEELIESTQDVRRLSRVHLICMDLLFERGSA